MAKSKEDPVLELPVTYGGLSVGDKTCRIGMSVSRSNYSVSKADKQILEAIVIVVAPGQANGIANISDERTGGDDREGRVHVQSHHQAGHRTRSIGHYH